MGMLEDMIRGVMDRQMSREYPQAQLPPIMLAQVSTVSETGTGKEEHRQVQVDLIDGPEIIEAVIHKKGYVYSLRILGSNGEPDSRYPVIPGVRSLVQVEPGDKVVVAMLYGALDPYIIGEVI